jgi:hypothetical protein
MARTKISEFSATPANNTDIDGINIAEGCAPSGINDAIRELMSQLKDWQSGTSNDPLVIGSSGSLTLSGGTANGVAYLNGSKVLTTGSALTFDGASFRSSSGIIFGGTNSYLYEGSSDTVNLRVGADGPYMILGQDLGSGVSAFGNASGNVAFYASNSEQMRLTSTGLGIGTSSPSYKLDVSAAGNESGRFKTSGSINALYLADSNTTAGTLYIGTVGNDFRVVTGSNERARIDSSGNFGLGVTPSAWVSPALPAFDIGTMGGIAGQTNAANLHFLANAYLGSGPAWKYKTSNYASRFTAGNDLGTGGFSWFTAPSGTAGNAISFTQAMTLDASGNVIIGTTTPGGKLRAAQSANDIALRLDMANTGFTNQLIYLTCNTPEGTGYTIITYRNENAARDDFIVFGNGNVQNRNNSYAGISDAKLKENIVDATPKLADLMQVKVRTYNLIGDTQKQIGVIAQELEQVFPAMVEESPDREVRKTIDENGVEIEESVDLGTTTKSVKYSVFVPMLIKAMQEQQAMIAELKGIVDQQAARIAALESK